MNRYEKHLKQKANEPKFLSTAASLIGRMILFHSSPYLIRSYGVCIYSAEVGRYD